MNPIMQSLNSSTITFACVILAFGVCLMGCQRNAPDPNGSISSDGEKVIVNVGGESLYLTPASKSAARAAALLPTQPSEDVSHLLGRIELTEPPTEAEVDYLPYPAVEWVVTAEFSGRPKLNPQAVANLFDQSWRKQFGGLTIYGRDAETGRWTFLISADGPKAVTDLKLAWDYASPIHDDEAPPPTSVFAARIAEVERLLSSLGAVKLEVSEPPEKAAARSQLLERARQELDYSVVLVLQAPRGKKFSGKQIWDVMLCLGLRWGDMDCFHWENPTRVGTDYFFSVETSTPPGYFLPESIAADQLHTEDLVFVFSVPRCAAPQPVFDAMVRGVQYAQSRLGGAILDGRGKPADIDAIRNEIIYVEDRLNALRLPCGSDNALRLF